MAEKEIENIDTGPRMYVSIGAEGDLILGKQYELKIEILDLITDFEPKEEDVLDVVIHTDGAIKIEDEEDWVKSVPILKSNDHPAIFKVVAHDTGAAKITTKLFFKNHLH